MQQNLFTSIYQQPNSETSPEQEINYTFIDLFAGIGGFHIGLKRNEMICVFASEIDEAARYTYLQNHDLAEELFNSDLRKIAPVDIPDHDILCAGFPCQPFSQAGHKKGFTDGDNSERGNLFFCILDILEAKRPKAFILENVRHLLNHDDGKTFQRIKNELLALNYSVDYKILKASDFGLPQHRPRIFIVGFNCQQVDTRIPFEFPSAVPLLKTMSDIWGGNCSKQIGFTLRVGGRGSDINDRRNWDAYLVDGEIKRLGPIEGKKMMGFPDDFILHPVRTQAMKQLGNSVCPDVVYFVAQQVKQYLIKNTQRTAMLEPSNNFKLNKGEWSELYVFLYLLINNQLPFGSLLATPDADYVNVIKIKHPHTKTDYILNSGELEIVQLDNQQTQTINISTILNKLDLHDLLQKIQTTSATTFNLPELKFLLDKLTITQHFKANSATKGDLLISFAYQNMEVLEQSVGIKSYLGNPPTLLNSSSATNFIFELINFSDDMDKINQIATRSKIKDRILQIKLSSNGLKFIGCENSIHEDNLRKVDSKMPEILASILLSYYSGEASKLTEFNLTEQQIVRIKDYLKAIVLGMFSSTSWDGNYTAHGYILLQQQGDLLLYHVIKDKILKDYLFLNARLDTPSSTRHRFGTIYRENNSYYIKLNLQIRMLGK